MFRCPDIQIPKNVRRQTVSGRVGRYGRLTVRMVVFFWGNGKEGSVLSRILDVLGSVAIHYDNVNYGVERAVGKSR
jgi:hypothetical protein